MTRLDWARWPAARAWCRVGWRVGRAARGTSLRESRMRYIVRIEPRGIGPGPAVPRRPRPGPCRRTARCAARRGPAAALRCSNARGGVGRGVVAGWGHGAGGARADDADRASLAARPEIGKPLPYRRAKRVLRRRSWLAPVALGRRQGNPQDLREFFLDLDDHLGLAELGRQPPGFSQEPLVLGDQGGVGIGLSPTTFRAQAGQRPLVALVPPRAEQRRVQALASQQAPSWPGPVERSASWSMRSLYSAVNRRRTGLSKTAGSGIGLPSPAAGPPGAAATAGIELSPDSSGNPGVAGRGGAVAAAPASTDPDIQLILANWPRLPKALRQGIIAMIRAAVGQSGPPWLSGQGVQAWRAARLDKEVRPLDLGPCSGSSTAEGRDIHPHPLPNHYSHNPGTRRRGQVNRTRPKPSEWEVADWPSHLESAVMDM